MEGIMIVVIFALAASLALSLIALISVCDLEKRIKKKVEPDIRGLRDCVNNHADHLEDLYKRRAALCEEVANKAERDQKNFDELFKKFERIENDGK